MDADLIFAVAAGVFLGNLGVLSVVWAVMRLKRGVEGGTEIVALCAPLLIVAATVYLATNV